MKREDEAHLDQEERELAAQLRRLPPHGEPSADLDARILAMARAAQGDPRRAPRTRSQWPAYASAAAVCALAAGLAWQLWPAHTQRDGEAAMPASAPAPSPPLPAVTPQMTASGEEKAAEITADKSASADAAPAAETPQVNAAAAPRTPQPSPVPPPAPPTPQPAILPPEDTTPAASTLGTLSSGKPAPIMPAAAPAAASAAAATVAPAKAAASPAPVVAPPPPPPPAPPAPPAPPPASTAAAAESAASANAALMAKDAARLREARSLDSTVNATQARVAADNVENGFDARPPATVQDASVRNDWLKRIRELVAKGDRDAARASLREYRSRYPDIPVPADLQPLLATPPTKSP